MPKRKAISKKLRFEIFKRDLFTCQYCGAKPPTVILEVDHVIPVASGGENQEDNLLTSCFDCNRGKGARLLTEAPEALAEKIKLKKEKQNQLKEFEKLLNDQRELMEGYILELEYKFYENMGCRFSESFKLSVKSFFEKLMRTEVFDALDVALLKAYSPERTLKYFCGVCWHRIRDRENG